MKTRLTVTPPLVMEKGVSRAVTVPAVVMVYVRSWVKAAPVRGADFCVTLRIADVAVNGSTTKDNVLVDVRTDFVLLV